MAISKERLEELIEQGATIWSEDWEEIKLDKNTCEICAVKTLSGKHLYWCLDFEYECNNEKQHTQFDLDELEEDVEKYRWEREFGCIEWVERLKLPTWEEIENIIEQKKKFGLNHSDRILARIITKDSIYYFKLCKYIDLFTFQMKQTYIGEDLCEQLTSRFPVCLGKATKENYYKACRKAKELFLGG